MNSNINSSRITFTEFVCKLKLLESASDKTMYSNGYLEDFFDNILVEGLKIEEVVTGDIAQVTEPLMTLNRKTVYESAPKSKEAEDWILKNKSSFKKRYGDEWEQILYATAWKIFGNK